MTVRHCDAEDTTEEEVWEVNGNTTAQTLLQAATFALQLDMADTEYVISHHKEDDYEPFEVIMFYVSK